MNFSQVINAYSGHMESESRRNETSNRIAWETTRWQTWILYNLQVKKSNRKATPLKLIKFEWDKPVKATEADKERLKRADESFPKRLKDGDK